MKRLLIPAAILIVILVVWFIQSRIEKSRTSAKSTDNFLGLKAGEINRVDIRTAKDKISLRLEGGRWILDGTPPRPADSMAVRNMLDAAVDLKVGSILSENPERQKGFMVDSITGNLVKFYNGDRLLSSIIVGKMTPDYQQTYVRRPDSREVYVAQGMLTFVFSRQRTQWLNRTILSFDPSGVKEVNLTYPDNSFRLSFSNAGWYISKPPFSDSLQADSMKATAFINNISHLNASDFADITDSGKVDFSSSDFSLNVKMADDKTIYGVIFSVAQPEASRFYCHTLESADTVVIPKSAYQNLKREFSSFLP